MADSLQGESQCYCAVSCSCSEGQLPAHECDKSNCLSQNMSLQCLTLPRAYIIIVITLFALQGIINMLQKITLMEMSLVQSLRLGDMNSVANNVTLKIQCQLKGKKRWATHGTQICKSANPYQQKEETQFAQKFCNLPQNQRNTMQHNPTGS